MEAPVRGNGGAMTVGVDLLDDLFHFCALRAYLEQSAVEPAGVPDSEATRRRAFDYYEEALAEKNKPRTLPEPSGDCQTLTIPRKGARICP